MRARGCWCSAPCRARNRCAGRNITPIRATCSGRSCSRCSAPPRRQDMTSGWGSCATAASRCGTSSRAASGRPAPMRRSAPRCRTRSPNCCTRIPAIRAVAFNGSGARRLYDRHFARRPDLAYLALPSTSPAYARIGFAAKLAQWRRCARRVGIGIRRLSQPIERLRVLPEEPVALLPATDARACGALPRPARHSRCAARRPGSWSRTSPARRRKSRARRARRGGSIHNPIPDP